MSLGNLDRRRANGPSTSAPIYAAASSASKGDLKLSSRVTRDDLQASRPLFVQTGLVSQASGSAYLESDTIKVTCAVYGPKQMKSKVFSNDAELNVDVRFASFATTRRKKAGKGTESPSVADAVRSALLPSLRLDLLPKASIDVFITVLEVGVSRGNLSGQQNDDDENNDGACAAAATTVASCALADAGIEMWALVIGINGVLNSKGIPIVDLSQDEAHASDDRIGHVQAAMSLYSMPALGTVTSLEQWGQMSLEEMDTLMNVLQSASVTIHFAVAKTLKESFLAREIKSKR